MSDERLVALEALFEAFAEAETHFQASRVEFVRGLRAVLDAVDAVDVDDNPLATYARMLKPYSTTVQAMMDVWLKRVAPDGTDETPASLDHVDTMLAFREQLVRTLMRIDPTESGDERQGFLTAVSLLDAFIEDLETQTPPNLDTAGSSSEDDNRRPPTIEWIKVDD